MEEGGLFPDTDTKSCVWFDNNMLQISQTNLCTKLLLLHGLVVVYIITGTSSK